MTSRNALFRLKYPVLPLQDLQEPLLECYFAEPHRVLPDGLRVDFEFHEPLDAFLERFGGLFGERYARYAVQGRFERSGTSEGDYGRAAEHRFHRNHPEIFFRREEEGPGFLEIPDFLFVVHAEDPFDIFLGNGLEGLLELVLLAGDDFERESVAVESLHE